MSGFAVIFNRDRAPVPPGSLDAILARLAHRGPDGRDVWQASNVAMGHLHFWTTPEDIGSHQPLSDPSGHFVIAFDGRLDNRGDLLAALGIERGTGADLPDAALALQAYLRWGDGCFERLLGPLAVAIVDTIAQRVVLARDALGSRSVYYHLDDRLLVAASEPFAVLAHPSVSDVLDESTLLRWFAVMAPRMGATFFADMSELPPAQAMTVGRSQVRQWQHWQVDPERRLRYRRDDEYAEQFRDLLAESVRCRLRATTPIGVALSGGYDSSSVAALAAKELAARPGAPQLRSFSWLFDDLPDCDERSYIQAMVDHCGLKATAIPGADAWPLRDWQGWSCNPNMPEGNAYRLLVDRLYSTVAGAGVRVLLTGAYADEALTGEDCWLAELLRDGRPVAALAGLLRLLRRQGLTSRLTRASLVQVVSWLLDVMPGGRRIRPKRRPLPPPWLTPQASDILAQDMLADETPQGPRPGQRDAVLGGYTTTFGAMAAVYDGLAGVEMRYPYRDRRLVEFLMAIPAYELFDGRNGKLVVYRAMAGVLPELVLSNLVHGRLYTLYMRGVERERPVFEELLYAPGALWRPYIGSEALRQMLELSQNGAETGRNAVLPWFCVAVEMWRATVGDRSARRGWRPPRETIPRL